jgi:hypothetical protein
MGELMGIIRKRPKKKGEIRYSIFPKNNKKGKCFYCEAPKSDTIIEVYVNWFRGDDDIYYVHKQCIDKAIEKIKKGYKI